MVEDKNTGREKVIAPIFGGWMDLAINFRYYRTQWQKVPEKK